jgi:hypothetical protein
MPKPHTFVRNVQGILGVKRNHLYAHEGKLISGIERVTTKKFLDAGAR